MTLVPSCEGGGGHGERRRPSKITPHERAARAAVSACLHNMLYLVRTIFYFSKLRAAPSRAPRIPLTARRSGLDTDFHTTHTPSCNKHFPSKDRQQQQANACSTRYESLQRVAFTMVVVNSQLFSTMVVVNSQHGGTTSADRRPTSSLPTMALPRSPAPVWKGRTVALLVRSAVQLHVPSDRARPRASRAERVPECRADATTTSPSVRRLQRRPSAKNCHVVLVLSVGARGGPRYAISTLRPSARSLAELGNLPGVMELTAPVLLVLLKPREAWEQLGGRLGVDCLDVAAVEDPFVMGDDVLSEEMAATSFTLTSETSFEHGQQQGLPFRSYDWSPVGSTIVYSCSINAAKELICGTIQVRWLFAYLE